MKNRKQNIYSTIESNIDEIENLISIIKSTKIVCMYNDNMHAPDNANFNEERNDYINLLTMSLEKLKLVQENNILIEKQLYLLENNTNNCGR